ncbi:hypothetical protein ACF0H5_018174 [Mactra antiquata]
MFDLSSIMGNTFGKAAVIDFGIQWALWAVAAAFKTEKFYDLAGSGTFLYLAWQSLKWSGTSFPRQKIQTGLVMAWAARLGLYLFTRVLKEGKDGRFDKVKGKPGLFWIYWTVQGMWVFITLLPLLVLNNKKEDKPLCTRDYTGWTLWAIGFLFEVIADYQKSAFKGNPDNAGKFIKSGLWSISRYPNYFGEICMWIGIYLTSTTVMTKPIEYASGISPLFVIYLLLRLSGIPLQEKQQMKRWGDDPMFKQYVKNTAKLIPFIW